jgi:hypothetical protein
MESQTTAAYPPARPARMMKGLQENIGGEPKQSGSRPTTGIAKPEATRLAADTRLTWSRVTSAVVSHASGKGAERRAHAEGRERQQKPRHQTHPGGSEWAGVSAHLIFATGWRPIRDPGGGERGSPLTAGDGARQKKSTAWSVLLRSATFLKGPAAVCYADNSSSNPFASLRSAVSNPSVFEGVRSLLGTGLIVNVAVKRPTSRPPGGVAAAGNGPSGAPTLFTSAFCSAAHDGPFPPPRRARDGGGLGSIPLT